MSIPQIKLDSKDVGKTGLGLMQLTWNPNPASEETAFAAMKAGVDSGATVWSTATFYGNPGTPDANLDLIGRFFKKYPQYKDKITIVLKGGAEEITKYSAELEYNRGLIKHATEKMGKKPEIYSYARLPQDVSFDQAFQNLKTLRDEGLFDAVGTSEMKRETLEKVQKIVDVAVVEIEVSLWSYEQDTKDVISWSMDNKIPILAYSPLGRGFITGQWRKPEDIPKGSFQSMVPRFQGEAFYDNIKLVEELEKLGKQRGYTTSQLALAWVHQLSPYTIPIPGSSNPDRVKQNSESANIEFTKEELDGLNDILARFEVKGTRYPEAAMAQTMN